MDQERNNNAVSGTEKKKRRQLSAEIKYAIFLEASRGDVPVAEVLRKYGIHSTELQRVREKVRIGALKELSRKSHSTVNNNEAVVRLEGEKQRLEQALLELTIEHQLLKKKTS